MCITRIETKRVGVEEEMNETDFKYLMSIDKGCGMSYAALYMANRVQEEIALLKRKNYGSSAHPTLLPNSHTNK